MIKFPKEPTHPQTVLNLRLMKKTLVDGGLSEVRKQLETAVTKQGPDGPKRCDVDGLLLSVLIAKSDGGPLDIPIDQGELYI